MTEMECSNAIFIGRYDDLLLLKGKVIISARMLLYVELPKEVNAALKKQVIRDHYCARSIYGWPDKSDIDTRVFDNCCMLVVTNLDKTQINRSVSICKKLNFRGMLFTTPYIQQDEDETPNLGSILELYKIAPGI
jgi:hypothetical protein